MDITYGLCEDFLSQYRHISEGKQIINDFSLERYFLNSEIFENHREAFKPMKSFFMDVFNHQLKTLPPGQSKQGGISYTEYDTAYQDLFKRINIQLNLASSKLTAGLTDTSCV